MSEERYDVFLSHNSKDRLAAQRLAALLTERGVRVWLDTQLQPGAGWVKALEVALAASNYCAVLIGPNGIGEWQQREMEFALDRGHVVPVLMPEAPSDTHAALPGFLGNLHAIRFHDVLEDEAVLAQLAAVVRGPIQGPTALECPYRGLRFFDVEHRRYFFGREALTASLLTRAGALAATRDALRFIAIVGRSGSGKSSVARAGLIAGMNLAAETAGWPKLILRPGANPLQSLAVEVGTIGGTTANVAQTLATMDDFRKSPQALDIAVQQAIRDRADDDVCVILVDQFEECFKLCADDGVRKAFFANLMTAARPGGRAIVVICLRADEYRDCLAYPELTEGLSQPQVLVGAMSPTELRSAIETPAIAAGAEMESGLSDLLLAEVEDQPGSLPLLQYTLRELWNRREGRRLTVGAYRALGKVAGVLERRANEVFEQFSDEQKQVCRNLFLRLVQSTEGSGYARRPALFSELCTSKWGEAAVQPVVELLASEEVRLLTLVGQAEGTEAVVEIAHEALIGSWSRLRQWLDEDREFQLWRKRFWVALAEWERSGRARDALQRGTLLDETLRWRARRADDLNPKELAFIDAGVNLRTLERRNYWKAVGAVVVLLLGAAAIIYRTTDLNSSRRLAEEAQRSTLSGDLVAPVKIALQAVDQARTREAVEALHEALQANRGAAVEGHSETVQSVVFTPSASLLTGSEDGTARLWDQKFNEIRKFDHPPRVLDVAASPDGNILATAGSDGAIRLWRPDSDRSFAELGPQKDAVLKIAFAADGSRLYSACQDGGLQEWDLRTSQGRDIVRQTRAMTAVAASPDGKLLAAGGADGITRVWDAQTGTEQFRLDPQPTAINDLAFSADGAMLACASNLGTIQLWDTRARKRLFLLSRGAEHPAVKGIAFSPEGNVLVSADISGTAFVWSTKTGKDLLTLRGRTGPLTSVAFPPKPDPSGRRPVAIAGADKVVRVYELNLKFLRDDARKIKGVK